MLLLFNEMKYILREFEFNTNRFLVRKCSNCPRAVFITTRGMGRKDYRKRMALCFATFFICSVFYLKKRLSCENFLFDLMSSTYQLLFYDNKILSTFLSMCPQINRKGDNFEGCGWVSEEGREGVSWRFITEVWNVYIYVSRSIYRGNCNAHYISIPDE